MSVAWTTLLIIALVLPGLAFFYAYWAGERYPREAVRSNAVAEIGMALFVAILLHLLALGAIIHFDGESYFSPLLDFYTKPAGKDSAEIAHRLWDALWAALLYTVGVTLAGLAAGMLVSWVVQRVKLPFLIVHKWAHDILRESRTGTVTTYVMTTIVENNRVLMYAGHLEEFYLDETGKFVYLVLKNGSRYFMNIDGASPTTATRVPLFKSADGSLRDWEHLTISGDTIANVLFEPIGNVRFRPDEAAEKELDEALAGAKTPADASVTDSPPPRIERVRSTVAAR